MADEALRVPFAAPDADDVELRGDCDSCRVTGARVETWRGDALAAHRCWVCGAGQALPEHGGATSRGHVPSSPHELAVALEPWAWAEGFDTPEELVGAYFALESVGEVSAALERGEAIDTTFDVVDFLFGGGSGAAASGKGAADADAGPPSRRALAAAADARGAAVFVAPPKTTWTAPPSSRRVGGPYDSLFALASVAAADGQLTQADLEALSAAADRRGVAPLPPHEVYVRRPDEVAPPGTLDEREALLREMFDLAWADDELDDSELVVIRAFARAWGVDPHKVTEWTEIVRSVDRGPLDRWIHRIGRYLFPGW
jgi:hypothetical protein